MGKEFYLGRRSVVGCVGRQSEDQKYVYFMCQIGGRESNIASDI